MIALAVILPAILGALVAIMLRERLRALSLTLWLGWTLIGAGAPVLAGQLTALALTDAAERRAAECEADGGETCLQASLMIMAPLAAGLCGGLGWSAGAVSARLTRSRKRD